MQKTAYLYVDLIVAQEMYSNNPNTLFQKIDSLYSYYNTGKKEYEMNLEKFRYNEETWDSFFKIAKEYLDTLKNKN